MRWSRYYIPTLKEAPADAEVISHKLLIRAGMIRKLTSGIYSWLPLGLKTLEKASAIVRREMNKAGALEVLMPMVQPADLWEESGRWVKYGKELLRMKDRHDRDYCLGPTHEEVITALLRGEVRSYRQLPLNLYQIQTKFRDEVRPRFGLMRGREFVMKDAYSFDSSDANADISYGLMRQAYHDIFTSMALSFRPVEADSGAIGGNFSHEFMVLADTGEDVIAACTAWPACTWAANVERAPVATAYTAAAPGAPMEDVSTPGAHTVEEVCTFLKVEPQSLVKTLLYSVTSPEGQSVVAALVRGDRELNEIKLKNLLNADAVAMATAQQVVDCTGAPVGFAGPVGLSNVSRVVADPELAAGTFITGANKADTHSRHVHLQRDVPGLEWADLRNIVAGDPCPHCGGKVELKRGIEVGHIFKLGTKYSESMRAMFLDENGKEKPIVMGCYGIGVSRVVAASIEQNNDEGGMILPPPLAPFDLLLINLDPRNAEVSAKADALYAHFQALGLDPLYDDREERPGIKFKDADLIGLPLQVVVGGKGLAQGIVEVKNRKNGEKATLPADEATFAPAFAAYYAQVLASWKQV